MYTFKSRLRYSEVDNNALMKLTSIVNYMQDCSNFHSQDIGITVDSIKKANKAWYLNSWQIEILRKPELFENITIGTLAHGFDAFFGYRNFFIKDKDDNIVVKANSVWVHMDLQTMRPCKIEESIADKYGVEPKLDMEYMPRKIKVKGEFIKGDTIKVVYEQIDTNGHVNNEQYIAVAHSQIPYDFDIRRIRVEYKVSAKLGDIITAYVAKNENSYIVELKDINNKVYAIVEFTGTEARTEEI